MRRRGFIVLFILLFFMRLLFLFPFSLYLPCFTGCVNPVPGGFCPSVDSFVEDEVIPAEKIRFYVPAYSCFPLSATPNAPRVIVSLTTFPARVADVSLTLYSLMVQTFRPDKIVLYLCEREFAGVTLPDDLLRLAKHGLTIRFVSDNIRQYLKLIPALREFPDDIIVTYDDDVFYPSNSLEVLMRSYRRNPKVVHGNRARLVPVNEKGSLMVEYVLFWKIYFGGKRPPDPSPLVFPEGVSGTLYPPRVLPPLASNASLFLAYAPSHDDLWFWAMAVVNGRMATLVDGYVGAVNISGRAVTRRLCDLNIRKRHDRRQNRRVFEDFIGGRLARERQRRRGWY
jgi:hypothetical protein